MEVLKWERPKFSSDCFYRFHLPLSGKCHLVDINGETEVTRGKLYLIPPFLPLKFKAVTPFTHYYLHFSSSELYSILPPDQIFYEQYQRRSSMIKVFERINSFFSDSKPVTSCSDSFEVRSLVEQLLAPFIDHHYIESRCAEFPEQKFSSVLQYIENHLDEKIEIKQLQKMLNMSSTDFLVRFKNYFDMTPKQYVIRRKLSLAKKLLIQTDISIKEIAGKCGYPDEFFFSRIFKKYFNESPINFRIKKCL